MLIDGQTCCTNCGKPTPPEGLDKDDKCEVCRVKLSGYDEGCRQALADALERVADLFEEDGGDLIDWVCDRVRAGQRAAERQGEEPTDSLQLLRRFRELDEGSS
jgi:hypothetical protein